MRFWFPLLVLVLLSAPVRGEEPAVLRSEPANGSVGVPVDVGVLRIRFDRDMSRGSWTLWKSDRGEFPPLAGEVTDPFTDARTVEIPLARLKPGTTYAVQLNSAAKGRQGFKGADGDPLPDTVIAFRTAEAGAAPAPAAALDLGPVRADPDRKWTVLVYMAADNDVEKYAPEALNDIEAKFPGRGVEIVVLFDRAKEYDKSHGDWNDTRVYRVRRGAAADAFESEPIASWGERNMGAADTLAGFLGAGMNTFPAPRTCLVMWDHGMGWGGNAVDEDAPGAKESPDELTLGELRAGIEGGLAAAGRKKFDLVVFHMCLMAQAEIAAELMPLADYMVASEAMIPCAIVPYGDLLAGLADAPDPRTAATGMVDAYRRANEAKDCPVSTSSALDLGRMPALLDALDALAVKLGPAVDKGWPTMARSLFFSENYMGRVEYRAGKNALYTIDMMDALHRIRANLPGFPAAAEFARMEQEFDRVVIANYAGPKWRLSRGLAFYAPFRADMMKEEYRETAFAKRGGWTGLLDRLHGIMKTNMTPPSIPDARIVDATGKPTETVAGLSGSRIEFTVTGRNILWVLAQQVKPLEKPEGQAVMFRTFLVDRRYETRKAESAAELVDLVMPVYADGPNPMTGEVGGLSFLVTDGKKACEATLDYSDPADLQHVRVPAVYSHPDEGRCRVDIFFDVNWSRADTVVGYIPLPDGRVVPKMLRPNPGAEITLLYEVITPDGKMVLAPTDTLVWGEGLMLVPVFQEPGRYGMLVAAESIEGMGASRLVVYEQQKNEAFEQLAKEGGKFGPKELLGDWDVQNGVFSEATGGVEFQATDVKVRFFVDPKEPTLLRYEFTSGSGRDLPAGVVLVDTRGAPSLVYFEPSADGGWKRTEFHIAFHVPAPGEDAFIVKDVFAGPVYRFVRKGAAPPPAPGGSLAGTWRSADGGPGRPALRAELDGFRRGDRLRHERGPPATDLPERDGPRPRPGEVAQGSSEN